MEQHELDPDTSAKSTRDSVRELLRQRLSRAEIARKLGLSKATVSYHARRAGEPIEERCNRRYDWSLVQAYYDAGHSVRECIAQFGFSSASWYHAVNRGVITPRPQGMPISDLLVEGVRRGRNSLKLRLVAAGLKARRCEGCGIDSWLGRPLTLALHHINGRGEDNRLENLQLLCPNCHSQTENFAGRKRPEPPLRAVQGSAT